MSDHVKKSSLLIHKRDFFTHHIYFCPKIKVDVWKVTLNFTFINCNAYKNYTENINYLFTKFCKKCRLLCTIICSPNFVKSKVWVKKIGLSFWAPETLKIALWQCHSYQQIAEVQTQKMRYCKLRYLNPNQRYDKKL